MNAPAPPPHIILLPDTRRTGIMSHLNVFLMNAVYLNRPDSYYRADSPPTGWKLFISQKVGSCIADAKFYPNGNTEGFVKTSRC